MNEIATRKPSTAPSLAARDPDEAAPERDLLCGALLESRERWRYLVTMVADIAFETDACGHFTFVAPDLVLGWTAATLLGQPAELLLATPSAAVGFNPFRVTAPVRRQRSWLKRADGSAACLAFYAAPLSDEQGHIVGTRGLATDITEQDDHESQLTAALRRCELLDHVLSRMRQEVLAPKMMQSVLGSLANALGGEGAAVIDPTGKGMGPALSDVWGGGGSAILAPAAALLAREGDSPCALDAPDGRHLLVCACQTRFGEQVGVAVWRTPSSRPWDTEDRLLLASVTGVVRVILEHGAIQREMARHARTDPLTGLLNRRAFCEEFARRVDRLDREGLAGTLMFVDLDNFKPLNDRLGHEVGDEALTICASLLRSTVRPSDLVARLGGDEFALWLDGADHMTAAERAESLRVNAPLRFAELASGEILPLTLSTGIATRVAGSGESIESLMHRADQAMYEVKRSGRGHWRVSQAPPLP